MVLIGGPQAVSDGVAEPRSAALPVYDCAPQQPVGSNKLVVSRVFGADRYATARTVANTPPSSAVGTTDAGLDGVSCGGQNNKRTAIVASGAELPRRPVGRAAGLLRPARTRARTVAPGRSRSC